MLNKVFLIGNLGNDPEFQTLESGKSVAKFSIATSEVWKDKDGNKKEETQWHNCTVWGKQAEIINMYSKKGSRLYLEGEITYRSYEKDGEKKYYTEIVINEFKFLSNKTESNNSGARVDDVPSNDIPTGTDDNELPF